MKDKQAEEVFDKDNHNQRANGKINKLYIKNN